MCAGLGIGGLVWVGGKKRSRLACERSTSGVVYGGSGGQRDGDGNNNGSGDECGVEDGSVWRGDPGVSDVS